jgi:CpeT/CpcT family (DUF1001)
MLRLFVTGLACLALTSCATSTPSQRDPGRFLIGTWDNAAQMASAPETLKRPPVAGGAYEWLDGQHARFFPVDVPALTGNGAKAIYLVWRNGGPDGAISRQRLWVFRTDATGQTVMDFYAFKNPERVAEETGASDAFKALTLDDLTAYGPLCALPVVARSDGWRASIPSTCAITARSGRRMILSAQINVSKNTLSYEEAGTLEGGALAFKVPGAMAYQFVRK